MQTYYARFMDLYGDPCEPAEVYCLASDLQDAVGWFWMNKDANAVREPEAVEAEISWPASAVKIEIGRVDEIRRSGEKEKSS